MIISAMAPRTMVPELLPVCGKTTVAGEKVAKGASSQLEVCVVQP